MASRVLVSDDGTFRTYNSLNDAGQVIGRAVEQYVFPVEEVNAASLRAQLAAQIAPGSPARNAVTTNTTYIGLASPSAAQTTAEVKALAQQNNIIIPTLLRTIRLLLGALDADS